MYSSDLFITIA